LGPNRYPCGRTRWRHANAYPDSFSHSHSYRYGAAGNADTYSDTDATTYRDTDTEFTAAVAHASTQGNTKASSDSASAAVTAVIVESY
jgi:hypothetical protein